MCPTHNGKQFNDTHAEQGKGHVRTPINFNQYFTSHGLTPMASIIFTSKNHLITKPTRSIYGFQPDYIRLHALNSPSTEISRNPTYLDDPKLFPQKSEFAVAPSNFIFIHHTQHLPPPHNKIDQNHYLQHPCYGY